VLGRAQKVMKVAKSGGEPVELATSEGLPRALTLDDTTLYWGEDEGLFSVPKAGGKAQPVIKGASLPDFLVVDETALYWYSSVSGKAFKGPKRGGSPAPLYTDDQHTLNAFFLAGGELFFSYGSNGKMELYRLPKSGGKPTLVVGEQNPGSDFATDGTNIYWATDDAIFKVQKSGGAATAVVQKGDRLRNLTVDDSSVYWTDRGGRVQKMAK
jgi:hypothetical protein